MRIACSDERTARGRRVHHAVRRQNIGDFLRTGPDILRQEWKWNRCRLRELRIRVTVESAQIVHAVACRAWGFPDYSQAVVDLTGRIGIVERVVIRVAKPLQWRIR